MEEEIPDSKIGDTVIGITVSDLKKIVNDMNDQTIVPLSWLTNYLKVFVQVKEGIRVNSFNSSIEGQV